MKKSNFTGQFLKVCQEANITPLPINTKIENNQLKLFRYHMSDQIAQALSRRLE